MRPRQCVIRFEYYCPFHDLTIKSTEEPLLDYCGPLCPECEILRMQLKCVRTAEQWRQIRAGVVRWTWINLPERLPPAPDVVAMLRAGTWEGCDIFCDETQENGI